MRRQLRFAAALVAASLAVAAAPARAQSPEVPAWIQLLEQQPAGVDRPTWKEQRRDAARKLVASGDKRAVAPLIKLAEAEAFDVIGEIAITGLGALGDPAAIPVLDKIAADPSRDRAQRDLAKKARAKLGAKPGGAVPPTLTPPTPTPPTPTPPTPTPIVPDPAPEPEPVVVTPTPSPGGDLLGTPSPPIPGSSRFGDGILATTEQVTFAVGNAALSYDTVRARTAFDLDASGRYARRVEQPSSAYGYGGGARVIAGLLNPDGPATSRAVIVNVDGDAEFRAYTAGGIYGLGRGVLSVQIQYLGIEQEDPDDNYKEGRTAADLGVALGGGYGRVLDVGPRLRVRQLEAILNQARALGRPIDDDLAARLQSAWWDARRDRTAYRVLTATVAILRDAGVLLGEPDAGTTYAILEVLRDPSFDHRLSGVDANLQIGEEYLMREDEPMIPEGRTELVMARATVARQLGLASDAVGYLDARYRVLAAEDVPSPWRVAAGGTWRRFVHADHGELLGALDVRALLVVSEDDLETPDEDLTDLGFAVGGGVGWTWMFSRASSVRAGAEARLDGGEVFFGASLSASYGWLDAAFARSAP